MSEIHFLHSNSGSQAFPPLEPFWWEGSSSKTGQKILVKFEVRELADKTYQVAAHRFDYVKYNSEDVDLYSRLRGTAPIEFDWQYTNSFLTIDIIVPEKTPLELTKVKILRAIGDLEFIKKYINGVTFGSGRVSVFCNA